MLGSEVLTMTRWAASQAELGRERGRRERSGGAQLRFPHKPRPPLFALQQEGSEGRWRPAASRGKFPA